MYVESRRQKTENRKSQVRSLKSSVRCVSILAFWAVSATHAAVVDEATLSDRANAAFGLHSSKVATIQFDRTPGVSQTIAVPFGDGVLEVDLQPHSIRADSFRVRHQVADGSLVEMTPQPSRTVRGWLRDGNGTVVGTVSETGLTLAIRMEGAAEIWIEPLFGRVADATPEHHVVYAGSDAINDGRSCAAGVYNETRLFMDPEPLLVEGVGCLGLPCLAELACDADREFFGIWGSNTALRIETIISFVSEQYEEQVGIVFQITEIIVRTEEPDPYDQNVCGDLLEQFRDHWLANHQDVVRDEAHLFTGKNIQGCAGIAFGGGQICGSLSFGLVPNFPSVTNAASVSAHELGHNWSAQHCGPVGGCDPNSFPPGGCACACHTMRCSTVFCRDFNETCTVPFISSHRDTRPCLDSLAPPAPFPFADDFDGPDLDPALWFNGGATVDENGSGEPSAPSSLRISGTTRATSGFADATSVDYVGVEYWWQRTGNSGGSPELGEDLIIEYVDSGRVWQEFSRQPGEGADDLPFARACAIIPDADLQSTQIRVSMAAGQQSDFFYVDDMRIVDGADLLAFELQPELACACSSNGSAQFTALATGEAPISYQWKFNGNVISGETSPTLDLPNVGPADFGNYSVDISNACGVVSSNDAVLLEVDPVAITQHPLDSEVSPGGTLSLFAFASGGCADFQWFRNGESIPGATSSFLFIANMQCENQGCYSTNVSNNCSTTESDVAIVTVTGCPPVDCFSDNTPPEIDHADGLAGETRPYSGYIDPRVESSNGTSFDRGITEIAIRFTEPVQNIGGGNLTPSAFVVTETGDATAPNIVSVNADAMPLVVLTLDRPITLSEYTTVRAAVQDFADPANVIVDSGNLGLGIDETDRVDIAFLPGDVDQTGDVSPFDLLVFRQIVNDVIDPTQGTETDFVDTDRDNQIAPFDLLAFRQVVNGVSPATQPWSGQSLNSARP